MIQVCLPPNLHWEKNIGSITAPLEGDGFVSKKPEPKRGDVFLLHLPNPKPVWFFPKLVGGWTNPFEKYARQIGSFPQFSGWT